MKEAIILREKNLFEQLISRAESDVEFREKFLEDPEKVLYESGLTPESLKEYLSDQELFAVSGGLSLEDPNDVRRYAYECDCGYGTDDWVSWVAHITIGHIV